MAYVISIGSKVIKVQPEEQFPSHLCIQLKEYNENTSLHGPKYIMDTKRPLFERVFWIVVVLLSMFSGFFLVYRILSKWGSSPIITTIDDLHYPITEIKFPAVTICPSKKAIKSKVISEICQRRWHFLYKENFLDIIYEGMTSFIGRDDNAVKDEENDKRSLYKSLFSDFKINTSEIVTFLKKVTPTCKDFLLDCSWGGEKVNCGDSFTTVATENGFCCSFNIIPQKDPFSDIGTTQEHYTPFLNNENHWNETKDEFCPTAPLFEKQINFSTWELTCSYINLLHETSKSTSEIPRRQRANSSQVRYSKGGGVINGLTVLIDTLACQWLSTSDNKGIKVYVHNPAEFPEVAQKGSAFAPGTENFISITNTASISTESTKKYGNISRRCNFPDELKLNYYTYSRSNCEIEAMIHTGAIVCGCKPYYFPGPYAICNESGMNCFREKSQNIANMGLCYPGCEEVNYYASSSSVPFPRTGTNNEPEILSQFKGKFNGIYNNRAYVEKSVTLVHVFFQNSYALQFKRDELYSIEDIISNIGGTLGLCLGFSFVSIIEIIYFITCRLCLQQKKKF